MTKAEIFEFFRLLAEDNPEPETELEFGNVYQLLVAVVLSAQATDAGVNKATRALFAEVKTPAQMVALGEEGLKQRIKTMVGVSTSVQVLAPEAIERTLVGKAKRVVDQRPKA